ncbi:histidine--tRNA ligase [Candidatus Saccharibacteria bacterium]|nr:MAG: histidine--tRNA ligase [Candidatus Saccharibacteria bacterium]
MSLSTQPYKGTRDFYPEDMRLQKHIFDVWRQICERFGYEEYTAPVLESAEIFEAKSGQEIVNEEMYTLVDKGDRRLALRPEMTPSVSRMVAGRRQELAYPLRWYSIPDLWRYDRPQRGRLRQHWQLNVDIFGVEGAQAEHEIILLADQIMREFGAKRNMYEIRLNNRQFVDFLLKDHLGLSDTEAHSIAKLIDKMYKLPDGEFEVLAEASLAPSHRESGVLDKLQSILKVKDIELLPEELKTHRSLRQIATVLSMLAKAGVSNARFDITLMRGFDYYTGVVFEVFDLHPDNNRAMFGGGRYDGLVGMFGVDPVPTVGFGQGDVGMQLFLESHDLLPKLNSETELYAVVFEGYYEKAQKLIHELREMGLNVAVDASGRKLDKCIRSAEKKSIRFVAFLGENELAEDQLTIKDIISGKEEKHSPQRVVSIIKDQRNRR